MKVLVAQRCGFCPGVRNAIQMAENTLGREKCVYSLGEVIHNKDVVDKLAGEGLKTVTSVEQIPSGTVLIRSHGATAEQFREIKDKGLKIINATCILVKRVQKIAKKLYDDGYLVIIIGDKGHPEVQAIVGSAEDVVVVGNK
ncbi:MAG: bifunctional 4-hydroxy-3-methylbut-2-enyl diphosphate reductase/30S ribosomal protein S1, partial [Planctomycetes bacterium]|nr:bifunctional 4-hydroxy-3-methylbut-2-enyl diphosphate reductase/30S ribosomal protein S1 [Planctomycetota bacterium]